MKNYSYSKVYNEDIIKRVLNQFKSTDHQTNENLQDIYFRNDYLLTIDKTKDILFFLRKEFQNILFKKLKETEFNPFLFEFQFQDGYYEFRFIGDCVIINGHEYYKFFSISDSIDGSMALQFNKGYYIREYDTYTIISYNNKSASNSIRHGKYSFKKNILYTEEYMKNFDKVLEKQRHTMERLNGIKVSYSDVIKKIIEYKNGKISQGSILRLRALNRRMRKMTDDEDIKLKLKKPKESINEKFKLEFSAVELFHNYMDIYKSRDSGEINRESNRILKILFKIIENNSIKNNHEREFKNKTGINFYEFYMDNFEKLVWYLSSYTKDSNIAQDAANEAFVQGLEKIDTYNPEKAKINTWVYKIAENIVKRNFKDEKKMNKVSINNSSNDDEVNYLNFIPYKDDNEIDKQYIISEQAKIIRSVIYNLPKKYDKYRTVLIMREMENMKYEEIAQALDIKLGTIKSQIKKGREIVKEKATNKLNLLHTKGLV